MTSAPNQDTAPLAHADVIVLDYLAALWAESEGLAPELRDELMTTVADYIAARRTSVSDALSDPEQIVGRLGPPEALVASVRRGRMPSHLRMPLPPALPVRARPPVQPHGGAGSDPAALALLMGGGFVLPVISPVAAMAMVSASPRWSISQKTAAWVLVLGSMFGGFVLSVLTVAATDAPGLALLVAYLVAVTGSMIAGCTLLPQMSRRG
jgi:hypothetical protein